MPLTPCRWREPIPRESPESLNSPGERFVCQSRQFVHPPNVVTPDLCAGCKVVDHAPVSPKRSLPCVHLGMPRDPSRFACALHGDCALESPTVASGLSCDHCRDYLPRPPHLSDSAEMRDRADAILATVSAYPHDRYTGRGVVIVGGGARYLPSLFVSVNATRHVGCRLPIEIWYFGNRDELPPEARESLQPLGVELIDADEVQKKHPARHLNGWELKVYATLHSRFEELLFLDADCYPCRNPEFLFDDPGYRQHGAIFWPDIATFDDRLKWAAFHVTDPKRPGSIESGQFIIDKRRCWSALNLAWFYNDHSDYYYRYCYGDKHTFEVAWARCGLPFVMWDASAEWADVAYLHRGPDGQPLFVHRCADKFRTGDQTYLTNQNHLAPTYYPSLPLEAECWTWFERYVRQMSAAESMRSAVAQQPPQERSFAERPSPNSTRSIESPRQQDRFSPHSL
jgi:hypothetical protein